MNSFTNTFNMAFAYTRCLTCSIKPIKHSCMVLGIPIVIKADDV